MNDRVLRRVAYAVAALAIALTTAGFMCFMATSLHDGQFAIDANATGDLVLGFTFPIVGAIVASRRPQNPIGWIYLAIGLSQGLNVFAWTYSDVWPGRGAGLAADRRLHVMGRRLDMGAWLRPLRDHRPAHLPRRTPSVAAVASRERRGDRLHDPHDGADRGRQLAAARHRPGHHGAGDDQRRTDGYRRRYPGRCPRIRRGCRGRLAGLARPALAEVARH